MRIAAFALVLLAASSSLLAQSPAPTPVVAAGTGRTRTLADLAAERRAGVKGVKGGTISIAGAPLNAPAAGAATREADAFQNAWIKRNADTRGEYKAASDALETAGGLMPRYIASGRGSSVTQAILDSTRAAALLPYTARATEAAVEVNALQEAARKAGAYPGWVRGDNAPVERKISLREMERQINNGDAPLPARDRDDRGVR